MVAKGSSVELGGAGFPSFDENLATLMSRPGGFLGPQPRSRERYRPLLWQLVEMAEVLEISLGAVAVYAWAARFASAPTRLWLLAEGASLVAARHGVAWNKLKSENWGISQILGADLALNIAQWLRALANGELADGIGSKVSPLFESFLRAAGDDWDKESVDIFWSAFGRREIRFSQEEEFITGTPVEPSPERMKRTRALASRFGLPNIGWSDYEHSAATSSWIDPSKQPLSDAAILAISRDLDGDAPYHTKDVPAVHIVKASWQLGIEAHQLIEELKNSGFTTLPASVEWGFVAENAAALSVDDYTVGEDGLLEIAEKVEDVADFMARRSTEAFSVFTNELHRAGLAGRVTAGFAQAPCLPSQPIQRHVRALPEDRFDDMTLGAVELVAAAHAMGLTYEATLHELKFYSAVVKEWKLPDGLPSDLAARVPGPLELSFFSRLNGDKMSDNESQWLVRGLRASAASGAPLSEVFSAARGLLVACNIPHSLLTEVAKSVTWPVDFDDLLVLGTQQIQPPVRDIREIEAMCRRFARKPADIAGRAETWLQLPVERINMAWTVSWVDEAEGEAK